MFDFDIVGLGEILIDFTPCGVNNQGIALFAQNPGGAPANVLAMVSKLGGRSAFIGKVGKDSFGSFLKDTLQNSGIDTTGLVVDSEIPTTLAFVHLNQAGDRSFTFYRNPGADMRLSSEEVKKELIDSCKLFHFGSVSLTDDPSRTATLDAAAYGKKQGKIVSFDPNYRPVIWDTEKSAIEWISHSISFADILKISEEEMLLVTKESNIERGSKMLLDMGPKAVFVTMGKNGAYYRNNCRNGSCPTYKMNTIDTTGAGDAFMGAVLWQLKDKTHEELSTMDLKGVVEFANAAGSLTTTRRGAIPALPCREEIQHCVEKHEMEV